MFIRKNTIELKIQIQDLPEELGEIGQTRALSAEDLNLVAGGFSHQCISAASDM